MSVFKNSLSVVTGVVTGIILISVGEYLLPHFYPFPVEININDRTQLQSAIQQMPLGASLFLLVNYAVASFVAGCLATLLIKKVPVKKEINKIRPALICGTVFTLSGISNSIMIGHPLWFSVANLFVYIPFAYLGYKLVKQ